MVSDVAFLLALKLRTKSSTICYGCFFECVILAEVYFQILEVYFQIPEAYFQILEVYFQIPESYFQILEAEFQILEVYFTIACVRL